MQVIARPGSRGTVRPRAAVDLMSALAPGTPLPALR